MKHLRTKAELLDAAARGNWIAESFRAMMAAPKVEAVEEPKPARFRWTPEIDQFIRDGIAAGKTLRAMVKESGISEDRVRKRVYELKLSLSGKRHKPFTPEDDAILRELAPTGIGVNAMARLMNRTPCSVSARACRLGVSVKARKPKESAR